MAEYTAFEKWEYRQLIYKTDHEQSWRDLAVGYFEAAFALAKGVAGGSLKEDIEGLAAVFLFRHYLELILKQIILRGRLLVNANERAIPEEVKQVANIHDLAVLWKWVLQDSKPKIADWDNYDTDFVETCISEFDAVDKKGFTFRYPGEGGEFCRFDYGFLPDAMKHVQEVLDGIATYLYEELREIGEYEHELEQEFRSSVDYGYEKVL